MSYTLAQLVGKDNAATTINHAGGYAAGVTSIVVTNAALLPATTPYAIAIGADTANYEEVVVSSVSSNTLTLLTATVNVHADAESVENTVGAEVLKRLADFATAHTHTSGNDGAVLADPNAVTTAVHGLPASVAVLGDRNASGEFIQHALASVTYGAGSSFALNNWHQVAVTFPVAFAATPIVLLGGGDQANAAVGVAIAISTTGFTIRVWDNQASSFAGSFGYVALGT